jgi:hypothetical protein
MNPTGAGPACSDVPQADYFCVGAHEQHVYYDSLISLEEHSGRPNAHEYWADG